MNQTLTTADVFDVARTLATLAAEAEARAAGITDTLRRLSSSGTTAELVDRAEARGQAAAFRTAHDLVVAQAVEAADPHSTGLLADVRRAVDPWTAEPGTFPTVDHRAAAQAEHLAAEAAAAFRDDADRLDALFLDGTPAEYDRLRDDMIDTLDVIAARHGHALAAELARDAGLPIPPAAA